MDISKKLLREIEKLLKEAPQADLVVVYRILKKRAEERQKEKTT